MRAVALLVPIVVLACAEPSPGGAAPDACAGSCEHADGGGPAEADAATATCAGVLPAAAAWQDGSGCGGAEVEVHRYDPDTFILRQSLCTSFEAPFLYLLFGDDVVLLEDTGAGGVDVVAAVDDVIADWLAERGRPSIELVVVNSHGHGDHVAGNAAFAARPGTTVVGASVAALMGRFGLADWPAGQAAIDLGGRVVDLYPIPGHQSAHVALYDRATEILLTGDSLYPGRLYVSDFAAFRASMNRLVELTATRPPCHVLGTHIEMTQQAGVDFDFGATDHPAERALGLSRDHLVELGAALDGMAGAPTIEVHDDFIVYPL